MNTLLKKFDKETREKKAELLNFYTKNKCRYYSKFNLCKNGMNCRHIHLPFKLGDIATWFRDVDHIKEYDFQNKIFDHNNRHMFKKSIRGAGFFPFTSLDGEIYVLLGYEKGKNYSFRLFCGGTDARLDNDCFAGAIRHLAKETYGVFTPKIKEEIKNTMNDIGIKAPKKFDVKFCEEYLQKKLKHSDFRHVLKRNTVLYLLPLPNNYFSNVNIFKEAMDFYGKENETDERTKIDFGWFPFSQIKKQIDGNPVKLMGDIFGIQGYITKFDFEFMKEFANYFENFEKNKPKFVPLKL